ncbi:MAG: GPW/gp25 family protein [Acidiferrobacterales bacterium]
MGSMPIGFTFPFEYASGSLGGLRTTNAEIDAVREDLKSLILTNWGERPMHYYMGGNLREFLFEPMDPGTLRERVGDRIVTQTKQWLPFVNLTTVTVYVQGDKIPSNVGAPAPENGFSIYLVFALSSDPNQVRKLYQPIVP